MRRLSYMISVAILLLLVTLPVFGYRSSESDKEAGLVKGYAEKHSIYFEDATLISRSNIATVAEHGLPDIRCFDAEGKALTARNCMASIDAFVDSVNKNRIAADSTGEPFDSYTASNSIVDMQGRPVTLADVPRKKYYIFYSYNYEAEKRSIPLKDLQEAYARLSKAYALADTGTIGFYTVCITGIALNNIKFTK